MTCLYQGFYEIELHSVGVLLFRRCYSESLILVFLIVLSPGVTGIELSGSFNCMQERTPPPLVALRWYYSLFKSHKKFLLLMNKIIPNDSFLFKNTSIRQHLRAFGLGNGAVRWRQILPVMHCSKFRYFFLYRHSIINEVARFWFCRSWFPKGQSNANVSLGVARRAKLAKPLWL